MRELRAPTAATVRRCRVVGARRDRAKSALVARIAVNERSWSTPSALGGRQVQRRRVVIVEQRLQNGQLICQGTCPTRCRWRRRRGARSAHARRRRSGGATDGVGPVRQRPRRWPVEPLRPVGEARLRQGMTSVWVTGEASGSVPASAARSSSSPYEPVMVSVFRLCSVMPSTTQSSGDAPTAPNCAARGG